MNADSPSPISKVEVPDPVDDLIEGVQKFQTEVFPQKQSQFKELARGQNPPTLFITCADSRVVPELITQTEPGDLFVCRNIGNIVPSYGEMMGGVSAVIEYACIALNVRDIVICGHSDCGAMKGLLYPDAAIMARMPTVSRWLRNAHAALSVVEATQPDLDPEAKLQALVERNVLTQLHNLQTHPAVAARLADGSLSIHGWLYDIETGGVRQFDAEGPLRPARAAESTDTGGATTV
jgi:carbonic anhydrase